MRNLAGGGVVAAHGRRVWGAAGEVARWFETVVAFARWYLFGIETVVAFAGEKWAFLVHFSGAEVSLVSTVPCRG